MVARRSVLAAAFAVATPTFAFADQIAPPLPPHLTSLHGVPLTHADGAATTLSAVLTPSAPSVITFWATWCPPCALEAQHLARLRARINPRRLNIVGINVDRYANEIEIARFLYRANATYTNLRGAEPAFEAFAGSPWITLPRLFVFARDGRPLAAFDRYFANRTPRRIDEAVAAALGT